jgi:hypothetical protein
MQLFTVGKVGCYCDAITHRLEKRKSGDEVKVVDLKLRIQPFTAQLAAALDPSVYSFVRRMLFRQADGTPINDYKAIEFKGFGERQLLTIFATPDTGRASIAIDECKVGKILAKTEKSVDGWALVLRVSFGPADKAELQYVSEWYTEQRFVSFAPAHPALEFEGAATTPPTEPAPATVSH